MFDFSSYFIAHGMHFKFAAQRI